jgi:hypothetical protein
LIGKTTQSNIGYLLDVAGNIRGNKLVVNSTGADYVFDSSYQLRPLSEINSYIEQNHHLPGIEPASQMQDSGLDVGANQTKLLAKIEELTLYLLQQQQLLEQQEQKMQQQSADIEALKKTIQTLNLHEKNISGNSH